MNETSKEEKSTQEDVKYCERDVFFQRFQVLLETVGLTQSALAADLHVTRQFIYQVAHKKIIPTPAMMIRIAQAMNTDTLCIWKDYDPKKESDEGNEEINNP